MKPFTSLSAWSLLSLLCLIPLWATAMTGSDQYPLTVAALHERYADEVIAHRTYGAFARKAREEGYPAIAHLFRALAASEAVHAANFARLLRQLGEDPVMPRAEIEISSTRENLQQAATVEAEEIDREYPAILGRIDSERHQKAIRHINYAWRAEQQHRDLILKIKKAASWYFGMLASKIEGSPTRYYVCQICGSTVNELPGRQCPICDHPQDQYREVPSFDGSPGGAAMPHPGSG